jgi:hypothetical protein
MRALSQSKVAERRVTERLGFADTDILSAMGHKFTNDSNTKTADCLLGSIAL